MNKMGFLKEKKGIIISFIVGVILASSITVYAYSYYARDIGYTKPGTNTEISVETALNELYTAKDILSPTNASKYKEFVLIEENISGLSKDKNIDVKSKYSNYNELTDNDFKLIITDNNYDTDYVAGDKHPSVSYDSNTGIATINAGVMAFSKGARVWNIVSLYVVR